MQGPMTEKCFYNNYLVNFFWEALYEEGEVEAKEDASIMEGKETEERDMGKRRTMRRRC